MGETIKEATIKLKLDSKDYESSLKGLDRPAGEAGRRSGDAFSTAFSAGLKGAKSAVEGLVSTIKTGVMTLSGLGSAPGTVDLAKHAMVAEEAFKKLAFQVQIGTGQMVDFRNLMEAAKTSSVRWGVDVDALGRSMTHLYEETGKIDVATGTIDTIATVARASRMDVEQLAGAAGVLSKKFKVANGDMGEALTTLISSANRGGVKFDELSNRLTMLGAVANTAGLEGKEGLGTIVGMLNFGEEGAKNFRKNMMTVSGIIEEMENKAKRSKMLLQLGIAPSTVKGDNFQDTIAEMLKKTGGSKEKLAVAFKNESQLQFMVDLGEHYKKAFDATTGDIKTKMAAGVAAFKEQLAGSGKSARSYAQVQDQAKKNMESAQARMDQAIEKMKAAFMRPEVTEAIGRLADLLPMLAEHVSNAVDLFARHPVLGTASIFATKAAGGAASGLLSSLPGIFLKSLTGGGAAAGQAAATSMAAGAPAAGAAAGEAMTAAAGPGLLAAVPAAGAALAAAAGLALAAWQANSLKEQAVQDVVNDKGEVVDQTTGESAWRNMKIKLKHDLGFMSDEDYQQELDERTGVVSDTKNNTAGVTYEEWAKRNGISTPASPFKLKEDAPDYLAYKYKGPAEQHGRSKEDAALFAQMMADRELKVRIVNPEAIRGGESGGGGSGGPGYAERP